MAFSSKDPVHLATKEFMGFLNSLTQRIQQEERNILFQYLSNIDKMADKFNEFYVAYVDGKQAETPHQDYYSFSAIKFQFQNRFQEINARWTQHLQETGVFDTPLVPPQTDGTEHLNPTATESSKPMISEHEPTNPQLNNSIAKVELPFEEAQTNYNAVNVAATVPNLNPNPVPVPQKPASNIPLDKPLPPKSDKWYGIPNGTVGKDYNHALQLSDFDIHGAVVEDRFESKLAELGLTYDPQNKTLSGQPSQPGEYLLTFYFKWAGGTESKHPSALQRSIKWLVNPDPRSLWLNKPSSEDNFAYWKPDQASAFCTAAPRRILAASQRGRSHAHEGTCRDDDFAFVYDETIAWYILAVADGAGSARYSREGSRLATRTAVDFIHNKLKHPDILTDLKEAIITLHAQLYASNKKHDTGDARKKVSDHLYNLLGGAAFNAKKALEKACAERKASEYDCELKDYATTLLLTCATQIETIGWFIASFWIGDGAIAVVSDTQGSRLMGIPDSGEFSGQTRFLTMNSVIEPTEIFKRLQFHYTDDFTALILMTDGISDPKFPTENTLREPQKWQLFWEELAKEVNFSTTANREEVQQQLLKWLNFWSPGDHDDRTILLVY